MYEKYDIITSITNIIMSENFLGNLKINITMLRKKLFIIAILGVALVNPLSSCDEIEDYDPYMTDCQDCDDNGNNNGDNGTNGGDDGQNNDQPPVDGADLTLYVDLVQFEFAYGQLKTNGDEYLNLYGAGRGVHLDLSSLEVYATGNNLLTIEEANAEAKKKGYDGVPENLYYDHIQKIWIWVYNKEHTSFMIEMKKMSWETSPSASSRFFDHDFEVKNEKKEIWFKIDGKKIAVVASLTEGE